MTNNDKLVWFESVGKCLGNNDPMPSDSEEYHLQKQLVFDCITSKLMNMFLGDGEAKKAHEGDQIVFLNH